MLPVCENAPSFSAVSTRTWQTSSNPRSDKRNWSSSQTQNRIEETPSSRSWSRSSTPITFRSFRINERLCRSKRDTSLPTPTALRQVSSFPLPLSNELSDRCRRCSLPRFKPSREPVTQAYPVWTSSTTSCLTSVQKRKRLNGKHRKSWAAFSRIKPALSTTPRRR